MGLRCNATLRLASGPIRPTRDQKRQKQIPLSGIAGTQ